MTSDAEIVERLRENVQALRHYDFPEVAKLEIEAAESITRLSARVEELQNALDSINMHAFTQDEDGCWLMISKTEYDALDVPSLLSPSTNLKE